MKFIKRLLSKDFREMEGKITVLGAQNKIYHDLERDFLSEKRESTVNVIELEGYLRRTKEKVSALKESEKRLKMKIREQSEADLLFASLKIINETVFKETPDREQLVESRQMRDHALSALRGQSATGPGLLDKLTGGLLRS